MDLPFTMPFTRNSLVSIDREGNFYTAWAEDFLIKVYDKEGNYKQSFYYPSEKPSLLLDELEINSERQRVLNRYELPETWPALHTMELDDEGRLWVATITESDSTFQWYVLGNDGEILARFQLAGKREYRSVMSDPLIRVHNGYFYSREVIHQEGIDRVIKYKIHFKQR